MMLYRNVLNFLRGSVQVEIECACPERVLNLCAVEEIAFWDLQWLSPIALRLRVTRRGWHALREVCTRADAQASRLRERGAPQLLLRLRTRYALLAALALFALLLFGGNLFIWSFEVTGNETVPTETILRALEKCGVAVGSQGLKIRSGGRAQPRAAGAAGRGVARGQRPRLRRACAGGGAQAPARGGAGVAGLQRRCAARGACHARAGARRQGGHRAGERRDGGGAAASPASRTPSAAACACCTGMGEVWARTWYDLSVSVPLKTTEKTGEGRKKLHLSLDFGRRRIKFYGKGSITGANCDKITDYKPLTLPGGLRLPVTLVVERTCVP